VSNCGSCSMDRQVRYRDTMDRGWRRELGYKGIFIVSHAPKLFSITFILRIQAVTPHVFSFSNPSVFGSEFGNDGVGLHACISAWSTAAVSTLFNPLDIFVQHEFCYFPWDTTENAFVDTAHVRRGKLCLRIWNRWPRFAYSLSNCVCGCVLKTT